MTRSITFTSLTILAAIAAAPLVAQARTSHDVTGYSAADAGNVVGGGGASLVGGGDDMAITYSGGGAGGGAGLAQIGRTARFAGTNGDGLQVEYQGPAPTGRGRQAWLLGGGDNAEVIYGSPAGR